MGLVAKVYKWHRRLRGPAKRHKISFVTMAGRADGCMRVKVLNISETGIYMQGHLPWAEGEVVTVELPETGGVQALVVRTEYIFCGCEFLKRLSRAEINRVILASDPTS